MGATQVTVTVRNPADPSRSWDGLFLVDTGATDSVIPRIHLEAIGLKPKGQRVFESSDGSELTLDITTAELEVMGEIVGGTIIYSDDDSAPQLGLTALASAGFEVDPRSQCLRHLPAVRLKTLQPASPNELSPESHRSDLSEEKATEAKFSPSNWAAVYAQRHMGTDPGICGVYYLPDKAAEREIRLIEVNELIAVIETSKLEALAYGVDGGSDDVHSDEAHTVKIIDVSPDQWARIGRGDLALPDGWSLGEVQEFDRSSHEPAATALV